MRDFVAAFLGCMLLGYVLGLRFESHSIKASEALNSTEHAVTQKRIRLEEAAAKVALATASREATLKELADIQRQLESEFLSFLKVPLPMTLAPTAISNLANNI